MYKFLIFILSLVICIKTSYGVDFAFYCKCYCPPNSTIVKVKDCSVCNKNLCIEQKLCVFQNSTYATLKPRNVQDPKSSYTEIGKNNVVSSLVSYPEYLYALLLGNVKRDYMIDINENENENIIYEKRKEKVDEKKNDKDKEKNDDDNDDKEKNDDDKEKNEKEDDKTNKDKEQEEKTDHNQEQDNKFNNETDIFNDNNHDNSTKADDEEETVISIIESGTDNGYQKSEEENWMTECFKRGSLKDESIIILFISSTGVLLVYAVMKKCFANNYEDGMKYNYTTLNNTSH